MEITRRQLRKLIRESTKRFHSGPGVDNFTDEIISTHAQAAYNSIWGSFGEVVWMIKTGHEVLGTAYYPFPVDEKQRKEWERIALAFWENSIRGSGRFYRGGWMQHDLRSSKLWADMRELMQGLSEFLIWLKDGDHSEVEAVKLKELVFGDAYCDDGACQQAYNLWNTLYR